MNDITIIDDLNEPQDNKQFYSELLKWWEKKRIIYNLIIITLQVSIMLLYKEGLLYFGIIEGIFLTFIVNIGANICYCLGWVLEILYNYYSRGNSFSILVRLIFFLLGIFFSIFLNAVAYINALSYYSFLD